MVEFLPGGVLQNVRREEGQGEIIICPLDFEPTARIHSPGLFSLGGLGLGLHEESGSAWLLG